MSFINDEQALTDDNEEVEIGQKNYVLKVEDQFSVDEWKSLGTIKQSSLIEAFTNPNQFFYRNRLPDEPRKHTPLNSNEREQFLERIKYFRETLHIEHGFWGYFSIPLSGRVGYQCLSFFYQFLNLGLIVDPNFEFSEGKWKYNPAAKFEISSDSISILRQEACNYIYHFYFPNISSSLSTPSSVNDKSTDPTASLRQKLRLLTNKYDLSSTPPPNDSNLKVTDSFEARLKQKLKNLQTMTKSKTPDNHTIEESNINAIDPLSHVPGETQAEPKEKEKKENAFEKLLREKLKKLKMNQEESSDEDSPIDFGLDLNKQDLPQLVHKSYMKRLKEEERDNIEMPPRGSSASHPFDHSASPVRYARDMITGKPIEFPMLDPSSGIILDICTWEQIFDKNIQAPFPVFPQSIGDLIIVEREDFLKYKHSISNIIF